MDSLLQNIETTCEGPTAPACQLSQELLENDTSNRSWRYRAYWNAFEYCLAELGWTPMSILDAGCGDATLLSWMASSNRWAKLYGLDFSKEIIDLAQKKHPCRVQYKVISQEFGLPYPDNSMDLVVSHMVLQTHDTPKKLFQEMTRVSKEAVIFSVIHPAFFKLVKWLPLSQWWYLNERHLAFYLKSDFMNEAGFGDGIVRQVAMETGFEVEKTLSPFPFRMYLLRDPKAKTTFKPIQDISSFSQNSFAEPMKQITLPNPMGRP